MDERYTCDCDGSRYTGDNCEQDTTSGQDDTTATSIGVVLAVRETTQNET